MGFLINLFPFTLACLLRVFRKGASLEIPFFAISQRDRKGSAWGGVKNGIIFEAL